MFPDAPQCVKRFQKVLDYITFPNDLHNHNNHDNRYLPGYPPSLFIDPLPILFYFGWYLYTIIQTRARRLVSPLVASQNDPLYLLAGPSGMVFFISGAAPQTLRTDARFQIAQNIAKDERKTS